MFSIVMDHKVNSRRFYIFSWDIVQMYTYIYEYMYSHEALYSVIDFVQ